MKSVAFGVKLKDVDYRLRKAAYLLVYNDKQELGIIKTPRGYFLPGGGVEGEEDEEACLHRECMEEMGASIKVGKKIGVSTLYGYAPRLSAYLEMEAHVYEGTISSPISEGTEADHVLVWLEPDDAKEKLLLEHQAWAVDQNPRALVLEPYAKSIPLKELMPFWKPQEIWSYCEACEKYNRFWSCPPHEDHALSHLKDYKHAMLVGYRMIFQKNDHLLLPYFEDVRQALALRLSKLTALFDCDRLIAGHCVSCETCMRAMNLPCHKPSERVYSLESLGFSVSDICEHLLGVPLKWDTDVSPTLMTVGVILSHEELPLREVYTILGVSSVDIIKAPLRR